MTYDWGWQGGPPMAISLYYVKEVLQYAKSQMPPKKIMMGQNLYGFDWKLPFKQGNPPAKAVSSVALLHLLVNIMFLSAMISQLKLHILITLTKMAYNMKFGLKMRGLFKVNSI